MKGDMETHATGASIIMVMVTTAISFFSLLTAPKKMTTRAHAHK